MPAAEWKLNLSNGALCKPDGSEAYHFGKNFDWVRYRQTSSKRSGDLYSVYFYKDTETRRRIVQTYHNVILIDENGIDKKIDLLDFNPIR